MEVSVTAGVVECKQFPFVIITSNNEREFPPAFHRRCLRLDMPEPNEDELKRILRARLQTEQLTAEIERLAGEFIKNRDGLAGTAPQELSTDQLISAAFVVMQGGDLTRRVELKNAILRPLRED